MIKKQPKIKERDILKALREHLLKRGYYVIRHQQGLGSHVGLSDITAIKDGETIYIEAKASNGKLSPGQIHFKECIEGHGGTYLVVKDYDDIMRLCYGDRIKSAAAQEGR